MDVDIHILFEDEHCLAMSKAAGQFTQGTWAPEGELTLEQAVRQHLNPRAPEGVYLGIVHRLDRPVSGVLLWAKTVKAARRLSKQFERRQIEKEYWAIVHLTRSDLTDASGASSSSRDVSMGRMTWTDWLTPAGVAGVVRSVPPGTPGSREAITRIACEVPVSLPGDCRWLKMWPETGRTHQLRVQSAIRGLPILGDGNYGCSLPFSPGIALHARMLRVRHPVSMAELELVAPVPEAWKARGIQLAEGPA